MNADVKSGILGPMRDCLYWVEIGFMLDATVISYSMDLVFKREPLKAIKIKELNPIVIDHKNKKYIKLGWCDDISFKKYDEVYFHIRAEDPTTKELTTNPDDICLNIKGFNVLWM